MGAIARESSRGWMGFSVLWGLNIAYSLSTLFYQTVTFNQHPVYSLTCILAVILFNVVVIGALRRARKPGERQPAGNTQNRRQLLRQPGGRLPLRSNRMASLIDVRDLLALRGRMEASQLSATLHTPRAR